MSSLSVSHGEPFGPLAGNSHRRVDDERREQPLAAFFVSPRLLANYGACSAGAKTLRSALIRAVYSADPGILARFGTKTCQKLSGSLSLENTDELTVSRMGNAGFSSSGRDPNGRFWQLVAGFSGFLGRFLDMYRRFRLFDTAKVCQIVPFLCHPRSGGSAGVNAAWSPRLGRVATSRRRFRPASRSG